MDISREKASSAIWTKLVELGIIARLVQATMTASSNDRGSEDDGRDFRCNQAVSVYQQQWC